MGFGCALPLALIAWRGAGGPGALLAALLALAGAYCWDRVGVRAGQAVPLSLESSMAADHLKAARGARDISSLGRPDLLSKTPPQKWRALVHNSRYNKKDIT